MINTEDLGLSDEQNKYSLVSDKFDLFEEWSFCETIVWLLLHVSTEKKRIKWFLVKINEPLFNYNIAVPFK